MPAPPQPLLLLSSRPWNEGLAERLRVALERHVHTISKPAELQLEAVAALDPEWIFVPHWSHWIPEAMRCSAELDAEGYPHAFLEAPHQRVSLRASWGWPDHHAASTSAPSTRAVAWSAG